MHYSIPEFGIEVETNNNGTGSITSNLHTKTVGDCQPNTPEEVDAVEYNAAIDGLEALLLALACEGIDISSPAFVKGIQSAMDAIGNNF